MAMHINPTGALPRGRLKAFQLERLRDVIKHVSAAAPYYGQAFAEKHIQPDNITSLDHLPKLPFTTKANLRDQYPYGMFTVPLEQIVRVHASSGTTGKPTVVGYTRADMEVWAGVMARTLTLVVLRRTTSSTMPTVTVCSQADWVSGSVQRPSALPPFPYRADSPNVS